MKQIDAIQLARFHAALATKHLQEAIKTSDAVSALVLLPLIDQSAKV
jgi:hypothetical protein